MLLLQGIILWYGIMTFPAAAAADLGITKEHFVVAGAGIAGLATAIALCKVSHFTCMLLRIQYAEGGSLLSP